MLLKLAIRLIFIHECAAYCAEFIHSYIIHATCTIHLLKHREYKSVFDKLQINTNDISKRICLLLQWHLNDMWIWKLHTGCYNFIRFLQLFIPFATRFAINIPKGKSMQTIDCQPINNRRLCDIRFEQLLKVAEPVQDSQNQSVSVAHQQ